MLGFGIILLIFFLGEILHFIGIPLPGSVIGMLLLTTGLAAGFIRRKWIAGTADFLLRNLSFFFVPAGVGIMTHTELFKAYWFEICSAVLFSFILVLATVGILQRLLTRKRGGA
ncbi:MAG: CidA/LrgA family protein [Spirochaetota bacterium]|nr:CidA/LrgA family protein [Spirochaetota bacterium]